MEDEDKLHAKRLREREKHRNECPEQRTTIGYNHRTTWSSATATAIHCLARMAEE